MADPLEEGHPWAARQQGWLSKKGKMADSWKSKYMWLEDCLLTSYAEDPNIVSTAKPAECLDLAAAGSRVLGAQEADAPVFSMPVDVEPASCIVVLAKGAIHIYHAGSPEDAEKWLSALRLAARGQQPHRDTLRNAPPGTPAGWQISIPSGRDTGTEILYKVLITHNTPETGFSRVVFRMSYTEFSDLHAELEQAMPLDMTGIALPTTRIFRSRETAAMPQRLEALEKYLRRIGAKPKLMQCPTMLKRLYLKEMVAKAKAASVPLAADTRAAEPRAKTPTSTVPSARAAAPAAKAPVARSVKAPTPPQTTFSRQSSGSGNSGEESERASPVRMHVDSRTTNRTRPGSRTTGGISVGTPTRATPEPRSGPSASSPANSPGPRTLPVRATPTRPQATTAATAAAAPLPPPVPLSLPETPPPADSPPLHRRAAGNDERSDAAPSPPPARPPPMSTTIRTQPLSAVSARPEAGPTYSNDSSVTSRKDLRAESEYDELDPSSTGTADTPAHAESPLPPPPSKLKAAATTQPVASPTPAPAPPKAVVATQSAAASAQTQSVEPRVVASSSPAPVIASPVVPEAPTPVAAAAAAGAGGGAVTGVVESASRAVVLPVEEPKKNPVNPFAAFVKQKDPVPLPTKQQPVSAPAAAVAPVSSSNPTQSTLPVESAPAAAPTQISTGSASPPTRRILPPSPAAKSPLSSPQSSPKGSPKVARRLPSLPGESSPLSSPTPARRQSSDRLGLAASSAAGASSPSSSAASPQPERRPVRPPRTTLLLSESASATPTEPPQAAVSPVVARAAVTAREVVTSTSESVRSVKQPLYDSIDVEKERVQIAAADQLPPIPTPATVPATKSPKPAPPPVAPKSSKAPSPAAAAAVAAPAPALAPAPTPAPAPAPALAPVPIAAPAAAATASLKVVKEATSTSAADVLTKAAAAAAAIPTTLPSSSPALNASPFAPSSPALVSRGSESTQFGFFNDAGETDTDGPLPQVPGHSGEAMPEMPGDPFEEEAHMALRPVPSASPPPAVVTVASVSASEGESEQEEETHNPFAIPKQRSPQPIRRSAEPTAPLPSAPTSAVPAANPISIVAGKSVRAIDAVESTSTDPEPADELLDALDSEVAAHGPPIAAASNLYDTIESVASGSPSLSRKADIGSAAAVAHDADVAAKKAKDEAFDASFDTNEPTSTAAAANASSGAAHAAAKAPHAAGHAFNPFDVKSKVAAAAPPPTSHEASELVSPPAEFKASFSDAPEPSASPDPFASLSSAKVAAPSASMDSIASSSASTAAKNALPSDIKSSPIPMSPAGSAPGTPDTKRKGASKDEIIARLKKKASMERMLSNEASPHSSAPGSPAVKARDAAHAPAVPSAAAALDAGHLAPPEDHHHAPHHESSYAAASAETSKAALPANAAQAIFAPTSPSNSPGSSGRVSLVLPPPPVPPPTPGMERAMSVQSTGSGHSTEGDETESLTLHKQEGMPLGISIAGGKGTDRGDFGIFINRIVEHSAAAADGRLQKGDQVLAVNGKSLAGMTLAEAVAVLKEVPPSVQLVVVKGGYEKMRKRAIKKKQEQGVSESPLGSVVTAAAAATGATSAPAAADSSAPAALANEQLEASAPIHALSDKKATAALDVVAAVSQTVEKHAEPTVASAPAAAPATTASSEVDTSKAAAKASVSSAAQPEATARGSSPVVDSAKGNVSTIDDEDDASLPTLPTAAPAAAPAVVPAAVHAAAAGSPSMDSSPRASTRGSGDESPVVLRTPGPSGINSSPSTKRKTFSLFGHKHDSSPAVSSPLASAVSSAVPDVTSPLVKVKADHKFSAEQRATFLRLMRSTTQASASQSAMFHVKHETDALGADIAKGSRAWRTCLVTLQGCVLFFGTATDPASLGGPHFLTSDAVTLETHKKRGGVLRVKTRSGEFLFQPEDVAQVRQWKSALDATAVVVLDCCHYISTESTEALDRFRSRTAGLKMSNPTRLPVVVLGLRGAGKTSLVNVLAKESPTPPLPTQTCDTVEIPWTNTLSFLVRDIVGEPEMWRQFYSADGGPYAIIFVVDSTSIEDLTSSGELLGDLLGSLELRNSIFVVVANKQGYMETNAIECEQIAARLGLDHRFKRNIALMTANANLRAGALDAFSYIAATVPGVVANGP